MRDRGFEANSYAAFHWCEFCGHSGLDGDTVTLESYEA